MGQEAAFQQFGHRHERSRAADRAPLCPLCSQLSSVTLGVRLRAVEGERTLDGPPRHDVDADADADFPHAGTPLAQTPVTP